MTPHAAHSGGLGQPALSLPGPGQLILCAPIRPAQLILCAPIRPAQLILCAPIRPAQLILCAPIRPAQLVSSAFRIWPAQQITCVLSWF